MPTPLLRFAPSPNGYLHLGHALSALTTWAAAAQLGGTALLRIEDIDTVRCRPEFVAATFADLAWLGLRWPSPVLHQRTRLAAYAEAAERLRRRGLLYPCFCSRARIAAAATATDPDGAPLYDGHCRGLSVAAIAARLDAGERPRWRLQMEAAIAAAGPLAVTEIAFVGHRLDLAAASVRAAAPSAWGDAVIVRNDIATSYHLSVVVDDAAQGITHVTRGLDLGAATELQVLLQALLALPHPCYAHHRLVLDEGAQKLAKSRGSESLRDLRAAGLSAADVRRQLGFS